MILIIAVVAGMVAGFLRAWHGRRSLQLPNLRLTWLVAFAFFPQWIVFYLSATRELISDDLATVILVTSQLLLLFFAWLNRYQSGLWALGIGLVLNLLVITLNGGLMPISPEMASRVYPDVPVESWRVEDRLGAGKDILLPASETRLEWLADRFFVPVFGGYRVAYSVGDAFIAAGAFWLLWGLGASDKRDNHLPKSSDFIDVTEKRGYHEG